MHLGKLYSKTKNRDAAKAMYGKVLDIKPSHKGATNAQAKL